MTVASDWLRAKMMVVSSTCELRPLMKIYTKEITFKKIIGPTQSLINKQNKNITSSAEGRRANQVEAD